jgi:indole-3-glycerol phosphate synthase
LNTLEEIFSHKREEVAEAKSATPMGVLREQAANAPIPRGFRAALAAATTPLALIAEVKKASPSQGLIRANFDAAEIAKIYETAGAHALSVLTEKRYFSGSPEDLKAARAAVGLPILRKDFVEDPYQVYEARAWGADAVLLIVAALELSKLIDLQDTVRGLGMDALVEVHDEQEAERAMLAGADLIGVNNRSLKDLSTDLRTAERILPSLNGTFSVAESALEKQEDLERMRQAGAKAVLIGTTFCRSENIAEKVRSVMGW